MVSVMIVFDMISSKIMAFILSSTLVIEEWKFGKSHSIQEQLKVKQIEEAMKVLFQKYHFEFWELLNELVRTTVLIIVYYWNFEYSNETSCSCMVVWDHSYRGKILHRKEWMTSAVGVIETEFEFGKKI